MFLVHLLGNGAFSHFVHRLKGQVPGHNWLTALGGVCV